MKKTLVALCVAAGMVGTASAADVQLYGLINTGLGYVHTHSDVAGVANTDTLSMDNGQEFGSRWGLRGGENLGNGYKVSFVLESGFESDTGLSDTKQNGRLFGREASISVSGGFGTLSFACRSSAACSVPMASSALLIRSSLTTPLLLVPALRPLRCGPAPITRFLTARRPTPA